VIARNSTAVYEDSPVDVRQVGKDLNVRYVLEGSMQKRGEEIRATAQLVNAATGAHVWSERWDRPAPDLFAVQTEIAEQVANQLDGWGVVLGASNFGHPNRGAEAADRALRLNPNYDPGTANRSRTAYFWAGRYDDALRIVERQPPENRTMGGWIQRAASYAALGRTDGEARTAAEQALAQHLDLSIRGLLSRPDFPMPSEGCMRNSCERRGSCFVPSPRSSLRSRSPTACRNAPPPSHALIPAQPGADTALEGQEHNWAPCSPAQPSQPSHYGLN
jgi:tetratricopeptide (TPR) repeat protein